MDWLGFIWGQGVLLYLLWIGMSCGDYGMLVLVIVGLTIGSVIWQPELVVLVCCSLECGFLFCGLVRLFGYGSASGICGFLLGCCVDSVFARVMSVISV